MDFDPDHEKWQFCCCRILTGLKLWTAAEILLSLIFTAVLGSTCYNSVKTNAPNTELVFDFGLLTICVFTLLTSILLMIGMLIYQEKLMYPNIFVRVALLIFVSAFGVSRFVLGSTNNENSAPSTKRRRGPFDNEKGEPSTALRLLFLVFFMIVVSAAVFFSIYLVVNGIRFVSAFKKLQQRRQSLILASQIDPELVEQLRRKSHASNNN